MKAISRGEVSDYPMSECDLDALVENITESPAAADSSGAGSPVPVSDPAHRHPKRNEKLMTDLTSLFALPSLAARYITEHGWVQGVEESNHGEVCLTGALSLCAPVPGDGAIARAVFRHRGRAEQWNDFDGRTQYEVVDYLANTEITDADLEEAFGPQWLEVVGIIRQVASATDEQIDALVMARTTAARPAWAAAVEAACGAPWDAAWGATSNPAWDAAWGAAWDAAWGAASNAAWDAACGAASTATRGALLATVTRDLIGTEGYTQEHYDQLMAPWRRVFGEVQP